MIPVTRTGRKPRVNAIGVPTPIAGLDLTAPQHASRDGYALRLRNFISRDGALYLRPGFDVLADISNPVRSLLSCGDNIFVATEDKIYTSDGRTIVICATPNDWMCAEFTTGAGLHAIAVSGSSQPLHIHGGDILPAPEMTGADASTFDVVASHQHRLFFAAPGSLSVWYLPMHQLGGQLRPIVLDGHFRRATRIAAIASLSQDGGRGADDQLLVIGDSGELAVYAGNPDDARGFGLVGVFDMPPPVGRNPVATFGGRLLLATSSGVIPVPDAISAPGSRQKITSISHLIDGAVAAPSQLIDVPGHRMLLLADHGRQWVFSDSDAWSVFDLPATCFAIAGGRLYFGTEDGRLCRFGAHDGDDGLPIEAEMVTRFSRFGTVRHKRFTRIRPHITRHVPYKSAVQIISDYRDVPDFSASRIHSEGWQWGDLAWPKMPLPWRKRASAQMDGWQSVSASGVAGAIQMAVQGTGDLSVSGFDVMVETGGQI